MLHIKTKIDPSNIHGIGLYADEFIPKGTVIWKFQEEFDQVFDPSALETLPKQAQQFLDFYAFLSRTSGRYILPTDHGKFVNHSDDPNCECKYLDAHSELVSITKRDIFPGEEITENYQTY